jgi:hypothetical protein
MSLKRELQFRNIANKLGSRCPGPESSSIGRQTDHARSWSGSTNCRRRYRTKCYLRLERLRERGRELRVSLRGVHHRILYFFHGAIAAVVSHGLVKEGVVPPKQIDRAIERKKRFQANPGRHTYQET